MILCEIGKFFAKGDERRRSFLKGIDCLTKVIKKRDPEITQRDIIDALCYRASMYFALARYKEAITDWRQAIEMDSTLAHSLLPMIREAQRELKKEQGF